MPDRLTSEERRMLLQVARQAVVAAVSNKPLPLLPVDRTFERLYELGVSFVTLTHQGELRGCIGALEPYQPLIEDVQEHAIAAALNDYRFAPVAASEMGDIKIEISRLTPAVNLDYKDDQDLVQKLRPGIDGVVLIDGPRRATFLPQVWEKISSPVEFLNRLCMKMGEQPDLWQIKHLTVLIYQVEEFHEE